jgi:hypothetical protein
MSLFYIEENNENALLAFNKKIVYDAETTSVRYPNLVDFNFGEKFFYGRVDFRFKPIYFSNDGIPVKYFRGDLASGPQKSAASFVVDAFRDLSLQFQKSVSNGAIYSGDQFLSSLKVYKSYSDPKSLYRDHLENYLSAMVKQFETRKIQVQNFEQFLIHFKELVFTTAATFPFTMAAYMKSKYCPIYATGLAIEIADIDYYNDEEKIQQFVNSKNWQFFLNACNSYGFMVDKAIPWRLVADIASNEMLSYAATYGAGTTQQIINRGYNNTYYEFFTNFRTMMLRLYDRVRPAQIVISEQCNGITRSKFVIPSKYRIADIEEKVSEEELLRLYFDIRITEEPSKYEQSKKQKIIRDCLSIRNSKSLLDSLIIFEEIINQPFDYRGSLSYIYRQTKMIPGEKIVLSKPRR